MDVAERRRRLTRTRPAVSRLLIALGAAVPLLTIFTWLCLLYGWESWGTFSPWVVPDEFERAQLSRAIAATGHAAQRTVPEPFGSLYVYLIAPAWRIHDTTRAYGFAKAIGVATMTSVLFPTYLLARMLVSKPWALFAAAGAAMIPALAYSSLLMLEPLAYPWAALCFYLLAKAFVTRRPGWIGSAAAACVVAPSVRGQLAIIMMGAAVGAFAFWFTGEGGRRVRRNWTRWDWIGFAVLAILAASVLDVVAAHHSGAWHLATQSERGHMVTYGLYAAGALTIGLGVLPTIAGLTALVKPRREPPSRERRAFVSLTAAMLAAFGLYTAGKAAFVSYFGQAFLIERNLIYVAPLLFVGTAIVFDRRRAPSAAVVAATAFALYLVTNTPYVMQTNLYFDAPGLSVLQNLHRSVALTPHGAKTLLIVLAVVFGGILALLHRSRGIRARLIVPVAAGFVLAWNAYGEITYARASHAYADDIIAKVPRPLNWIDRTVPTGAQVYYLGQSILHPNGLLELEFWNRSLQHVWSTDGTAPGPGPTVTPDVVSPDGRLAPGDGVHYMIADYGISIVGSVLATKHQIGLGRPLPWTLYRVTPPLRLSQTVEGVYSDGWGAPLTALNQYAIPNNEPSLLRIGILRAGGGKPLPAAVRVRVGRVAIGVSPLTGRSVPVMGKVLFTRTLRVRHDLDHVFRFKAPKPPFRVETSVTAFSPHDLDPASVDRRQLGAQVTYSVTPSVG